MPMVGAGDRSCCRRASDSTRYPRGMTTEQQIDRLAAGLAALRLDECSDEDVSELRVAALADLLLAAAEEHRADERALGALVVLEAALAERGLAWRCDCGQGQREDAAVCSCGGTLGGQVKAEMELGQA